MRKDEFLQQFEGMMLPETFDQDLLNQAAEMFGKWGKSSHMNEKEHLFETFGLASKPEDALRSRCRKLLCALSAPG